MYRLQMLWMSKLYSFFFPFFLYLHNFGETLNPQRQMNGNVTSHLWHQITNQIPDWCERKITWSIFDLCHGMTGGEKSGKIKKKIKTTKNRYVTFGTWQLEITCATLSVSDIFNYWLCFQWWQAHVMYSEGGKKGHMKLRKSKKLKKKNEGVPESVHVSVTPSFIHIIMFLSGSISAVLWFCEVEDPCVVQDVTCWLVWWG